MSAESLKDKVATRERVEATLEAKAAEAAKAAAEAEAAERAAAEAALQPLTTEAKAEAKAMFEAEREADVHQFSLGRVLLKIEAVLAKYKVLGLTIGRWAEANIPDAAGPVWGSSRAYRALLAARSAREVGPVGSTSVDAIQPVHAYLKADKAKAKAAFQAAKAAAPRGKSPTRSAIEAELAKAFPDGPGAGKPGPKRGSGTSKAAKAKAERDQQDAVKIAEAILAAGTGEPEAPGESVVKAALSDLGTILHRHTDKHGKEAMQPARELVRATVVWVSSHGLPAAEAAMRVWAEADKPETKPETKAPETKAAKPRTPRTRTTKAKAEATKAKPRTRTTK